MHCCSVEQPVTSSQEPQFFCCCFNSDPVDTMSLLHAILKWVNEIEIPTLLFTLPFPHLFQSPLRGQRFEDGGRGVGVVSYNALFIRVCPRPRTLGAPLTTHPSPRPPVRHQSLGARHRGPVLRAVLAL